MSALLYKPMTPYISWKGKTFYQITSQIQKNKHDGYTSDTTRNLFRPPPNKIYRREIATNVANCSSHASVRIDQINAPGGYIVSEINRPNVGLVNTLDVYSSTNKYENGDCTDRNVCASDNAKRRVRSSGMISKKKAYITERNSDNAYFTNTNQYLVSRNRTFKQNQYAHLRNGEPSLVNTSSQYKTNAYSPNGISHCKLITIIPNVNDTFYYLWTTFVYSESNLASIRATPDNPTLGSYKVVIPPGNYDIQSLNVAIQRRMTDNYHYYIFKRYQNATFLLNFIYNTVENKVELQSYSDYTKWDLNQYEIPTRYSQVMGTPISQSNNNADYRFPVVYFPPNHGFNQVVGFQSGFYPNIESIPTRNVGKMSTGFVSNMPHSVFPLYDIVYYKPSNTRFAVQGGVSSSDRVVRIKYDTITRNGLSYQSAYGPEVAHALAYGVSGTVYTLKDKYGYPNKKTPVLCTSTGELKCSSR
jgi:hypothetical protein